MEGTGRTASVRKGFSWFHQLLYTHYCNFVKYPNVGLLDDLFAPASKIEFASLFTNIHFNLIQWGASITGGYGQKCQGCVSSISEGVSQPESFLPATLVTFKTYVFTAAQRLV